MARAVVDLTRELLRIRTVNPPCDEARAATVLASRLEAAGLEVAPHELAPNRISLVARTRTRGDLRALCLTAHLDTVPLGRAAWERDALLGRLTATASTAAGPAT